MSLPRWNRRVLAALTLAVGMLVTLAAPSHAGVTFDASVTITNNTAQPVPGTTTTYVLTISNAGPSTAAGTTTPTFPFTPSSWTCAPTGAASCAAQGTGAIAEPVSLPANTSVVFTVQVPVPSSATGQIVASETFSLIGDVDDANDSAADTDTLQPQADVSITDSNGLTSVRAGQTVVQTIVVTNAGPSDTTAEITAKPPVPIPDKTWTCSASGGAVCHSDFGTGSIIAIDVFLPAGGSLTYLLTVKLPDDLVTGDSWTDTAEVASSGDPNPADNIATDTDEVVDAVADLVATKTAPASAVVGGTISYTIGVRNDGPDDAREVELTDTLPAGTTFVSVEQTSGPAATLATPAIGSGGEVVASWATLADGASPTFTVVVRLGAVIEVGAAVVNTAAVDSLDDPPAQDAAVAGEVQAAATIDPALGNNAVTVTTVVVAQVTTTTSTSTTSSSSTTMPGSTTTASVVADTLARTGTDAAAPTGVALLVLGAGLAVVGLAELRRQQLLGRS